jgi:hypothetical protein
VFGEVSRQIGHPISNLAIGGCSLESTLVLRSLPRPLRHETP